MEVLITEYRLGLEKLKQDQAKLEKQLNDIAGTAEKSSDQVKDSFAGVSKSADAMGGTFARVKQGFIAFFAVDKLMDFGRAIISSTATVQKFAAVLTNTLGSSSAAQQAMSQLQQFAAQTPFQLEEVTGAFIKMVNRGFKPTMDEMRKLGDLAASQGKSFDMLVEAILDAQTGEGERLKEFGIRLRQSGDNVSLSFKGITQTVKNNESAILDAILAYGSLSGVQGSMSSVSKTLEGGLSNLADNFFRLTSGIGNSSGILNLFVGALNMGVSALADWINPAQKQSEILEQQRTNLNMLVVQITDANIKEEERIQLINQLNTDYPEFLGNLDAETVTNGELAQKLSEVNNQLINKIVLQKKQEEIEDIAERAAEKKRESLTLEGVLMKKLAVLGQDNAKIQKIATSTDTIENKIFKVTQLLGGIANAEKALQNAVTATSKSEADPFSRLSESNKDILFLSTNLNKLSGIENEYNKIQNQTNDLISERVDLANKLGVSLTEQEKKEERVVSTGLTDTQKKDAEKAAQLLIKLRNDTNLALTDSDKQRAITTIQQQKEHTANEINELKISGDKKAEILKALELYTQTEIQKIDKQFADKSAEEAAKIDQKRKDIEDKKLKDKLKVEEDYYDQRQLDLKEDLANEVITKEQYDQRRLQAEIDYTEKLIMIKKRAGEDTNEDEKKLFDLYIERNKKRIDSDKEVNEQRKKQQEEIFNQALESGKAIFEFSQSLKEREIILLQQEQDQKNASFEADIARLERRKEQGIISEEEFAAARDEIERRKVDGEKETARVVSEIRRKQAAAEKAVAIFEASIQTAVAVTSVIANPVLAILVGLAGAAQVAAIAAQPLPPIQQFKKGTLKVKGGQKGKDSVPALLTPDEAVIEASVAVKYNKHLEAMMQGRYEDYIYKTYGLPNKDGFAGNLGNAIQFNDKRLIRAIKESKTDRVELGERTIKKLAGRIGDNGNRKSRTFTQR